MHSNSSITSVIARHDQKTIWAAHVPSSASSRHDSLKHKFITSLLVAALAEALSAEFGKLANRCHNRTNVPSKIVFSQLMEHNFLCNPISCNCAVRGSYRPSRAGQRTRRAKWLTSQMWPRKVP
jgi:hypothetical protein